MDSFRAKTPRPDPATLASCERAERSRRSAAFLYARQTGSTESRTVGSQFSRPRTACSAVDRQACEATCSTASRRDDAWRGTAASIRWHALTCLETVRKLARDLLCAVHIPRRSQISTQHHAAHYLQTDRGERGFVTRHLRCADASLRARIETRENPRNIFCHEWMMLGTRITKQNLGMQPFYALWKARFRATPIATTGAWALKRLPRSRGADSQLHFIQRICISYCANFENASIQTQKFIRLQS